MTLAPAEPRATHTPAADWVCPFCPLLCEDMAAADTAAPLACGRAASRLAALQATPAGAGPWQAGETCSLDDALQTAGDWLRASGQPLLGGLGTDVAGARALYRLACATGAIADSAQGPALTEGLRALQDRGGYTTTLAELRTRADLVLCLGGLFGEAAPRFLDRCLLPPPSAGPAAGGGPRRVVVLGPTPADAPLLDKLQQAPGVVLQTLPVPGDLHATVAQLVALVAGRAVPRPDAGLQALADALQAAHYSVLVGAPGGLPPQAALLIEAVHRLVNQLNAATRSAALWLGGGEGAATANQVFAWLSGLPLRSRLSPRGLEHQPVAYDAAGLLADDAVDLLVWVSSFDALLCPPPVAQPRIVFGAPALGAALAADGSDLARTVFIPVATPGVHLAGDLFRTDGTVLLPLRPWPGTPTAPDLLPLAGVLDRLLAQPAWAGVAP